MEPEEITKYTGIVDSFNSNYRFGSSVQDISFLTLINGQGGIGGLVIDRPDVITIKPILEHSNLDFYGGVEIVEGRHLCEESEFLREYIAKIINGFSLGYSQVKEDLEMLSRIEKALFENGLPDLVNGNKESTKNYGNVIGLRR